MRNLIFYSELVMLNLVCDLYMILLWRWAHIYSCGKWQTTTFYQFEKTTTPSLFPEQACTYTHLAKKRTPKKTKIQYTHKTNRQTIPHMYRHPHLMSCQHRWCVSMSFVPCHDVLSAVQVKLRLPTNKIIKGGFCDVYICGWAYGYMQ